MMVNDSQRVCCASPVGLDACFVYDFGLFLFSLLCVLS